MTFRSLTLAAAVAATLSLAGCGGDSDEPDAPAPEATGTTARVTIELRYPLLEDALSTPEAAPEECQGGLDYADIGTGSQITFTDQDGQVVGVADLPPAEPADNLVICTWKVEAELDGEPRYVTAEVGGWQSKARPVSGGEAVFLLDTVKEDPQFGSEPQVDPEWTKP